MEDLQLAVAKLRALSPKLNSAVEQAQRVVIQIEHFLAHECQVAIQAEVPVAYNDKGVAVTLLRYGRVDGKFRIALTSTDGDSRFVSRAWTECDRSEKLASFAMLPKLVLAVTKAVEDQINATTKTTKTVGTLMAALGAGSDKEDGQPTGEVPDLPRLTIIMRPEEALAATQAAAVSANGNNRPVLRPRPMIKANPDVDARRNGSARKEEAKAG
jgi:hypothetical protein